MAAVMKLSRTKAITKKLQRGKMYKQTENMFGKNPKLQNTIEINEPAVSLKRQTPHPPIPAKKRSPLENIWGGQTQKAAPNKTTGPLVRNGSQPEH